MKDKYRKGKLNSNIKNRIHIVADANIPFLKGMLEPFAEVVYQSENEIVNTSVKHADALIVRTRTQCNEKLLKDAAVTYIATATIGYDHIDTTYCREHNITWTNAPGCNAWSVAEYVICSLMVWASKHNIELESKTIGIVGVGNVGKRVAFLCENLGMKVLLNDPLREKEEPDVNFTSLKQIAEQAHVITYHVPLAIAGEHATYHLADTDFIQSLKQQPLLINSARGGIICTQAVLQGLEDKKIGDVAIDCWEHEPCIDKRLLAKSLIATPHIAGYSADGKLNATMMSVHAICDFFGFDKSKLKKVVLPDPEHRVLASNALSKQAVLFDTCLGAYNILEDSNKLKKEPATFETFRNNYRIRREFPAYSPDIPKQMESVRDLLYKLRFEGHSTTGKSFL